MFYSGIFYCTKAFDVKDKSKIVKLMKGRYKGHDNNNNLSQTFYLMIHTGAIRTYIT